MAFSEYVNFTNMKFKSWTDFTQGQMRCLTRNWRLLMMPTKSSWMKRKGIKRLFVVWAQRPQKAKNLWIRGLLKDFFYFNIILFIYHPAVTYAAFEHQRRLFWITCNRLKLLKKAGWLQLIQNSTPSVALMRQCCIRMTYIVEYQYWVYRSIYYIKFWLDFLKTKFLVRLEHNFQCLTSLKIMKHCLLWLFLQKSS